MALMTYAHDSTLTALGIKESVQYMFNQIGWNDFLSHQYPTYHKLTLEFLSSLSYEPHIGLGLAKGAVSFRLFGFTHYFTIRRLAELLGFPSGKDAFMETQDDEYMDHELNHFWSQISGLYPDDLNHMLATEIHNPAIRYFHMILAFTLFGKPINSTSVSKDELFIMFCVFQSRPVIGASFMMANLLTIARTNQGPIYVGGLVTMIAQAISLRYPLSRLTPFGQYNFMDLSLCFNLSLIHNIEGPPYQLLVNHQPIHHFFLPSPEHTSVHIKTNWVYDLEGHDETEPEKAETDPMTPPLYHYTPAPDSPIQPLASTTAAPPVIHTPSVEALHAEIVFVRGEITSLRNDITTLRTDFTGFMDLATEQLDLLYQRFYSPTPPRG